MSKKVINITVSEKYEQLIKLAEELAATKGKNKLVPTIMELVQLGLIATQSGYFILNGVVVKSTNKIDLNIIGE